MRRSLGRGLCSLPENFLIFELKMVRYGHSGCYFLGERSGGVVCDNG